MSFCMVCGVQKNTRFDAHAVRRVPYFRPDRVPAHYVNATPTAYRKTMLIVSPTMYRYNI